MIFTAVPRAIAGIIESFAILNVNVYVFGSTVLDALLLPASYLTMFLWIFAKKYKLNPVEKRNSFSVLSTVYMVFYGIGVLGTNLAIVALGTDKELASEVAEYLRQFGYIVNTISSPLQTISSAIAICVFIAYLIAVIVIGILFRKNPRSSETRIRETPISRNIQAHTAMIAETTFPTLLMSLKENTFTKRTTRTSRTAATCLTNSISDTE